MFLEDFHLKEQEELRKTHVLTMTQINKPAVGGAGSELLHFSTKSIERVKNPAVHFWG